MEGATDGIQQIILLKGFCEDGYRSLGECSLEASSVTAEAKVTQRYPADRSRLIPSQTAASSSTTAISGALGHSRYYGYQNPSGLEYNTCV